MRVETENFIWALIRKAWHYAAAERWRMVVFYTLSIFGNALIMLNPIVLERIINTVQTGGADQISEALRLCGIYAAFVLAFWALHGPSRIIERRLAFNIYHNFVNEAYRKVTEMPLRWHRDHHSGDTINRVTKAGKALFQFAQDQWLIISLSVRFVGSILVLLWYSWWVALISLAFCMGIFGMIRRFDRRLIPIVNATNEREHRLSSALYDFIGNIVTVLTLRLQGQTRTEVSHRFRAMRATFWQEINANEIKWAFISLGLVVVQMTVVGSYIAATLHMKSVLNVGVVVAIFQCQTIINQIFFQGTQVYNELLRRAIDVEAVRALSYDHERRFSRPPAADIVRWQRIDIEGLTFTHDETLDEEKTHNLEDLSLSIFAGSRVALVGASGSGKTTLLSLLRGVYEPGKVSLFIDGRPYDSLAPLASLTTLIPQEAEIFENTVHYNLTMGIEMPEAVLRESLSIAALEDVIAHLPRGLDTNIRERGVNFSGGQRQRLAFARGLIAARGSSLLLLDEPTSSVDVATEGVIFDRLLEAYAGKTIVASVHRLHLLPRFDWIYVMQDGLIVEEGTFGNLISASGPLRDMWESQTIEKSQRIIT